mgnify:CR=1 FL=1
MNLPYRMWVKMLGTVVSPGLLRPGLLQFPGLLHFLGIFFYFPGLLHFFRKQKFLQEIFSRFKEITNFFK